LLYYYILQFKMIQQSTQERQKEESKVLFNPCLSKVIALEFNMKKSNKQ